MCFERKALDLADIHILKVCQNQTKGHELPKFDSGLIPTLISISNTQIEHLRHFMYAILLYFLSTSRQLLVLNFLVFTILFIVIPN